MSSGENRKERLKIIIISFTILITVFGYWLSRYLFIRYKNALLNPVFLTTIFVILVLNLLGLSFDDYKPGKDIMTFLLGPATVALALPLYHNRKVLWSGLASVVVGVLVGSLSNIIIVLLIGKAAALEHNILISLIPKSITVPIAIEVAKLAGGDPALTALFVVATGMIGAIAGPSVLNFLHVDNPVARGLAIGTTAHGQGTAIALQEGETQGAMSGVAMALAAVVTSFVVPILVPFLI